MALTRFHRIASLCGAIPLCLGAGVFLAWFVVQWDWLVLAGIAVLLGGSIAFVVGFIALAYGSRVAYRSGSVTGRRLWQSALRVASQLLVNLPVAAGIIWATGVIATRYTVVVRNRSPDRLDRVQVVGGGCDAEFGSMASGATGTRSFWILMDDVLVFRASRNGEMIEQPVSSYVTNGSGGHTIVTVQQDGRIAATDRVGDLAVTDRIREVFFWVDRAPCVPFGEATEGRTKLLRRIR